MKEQRAFPFVALGLIFVNVLIFTILEATGTLEQAVWDYGFRPAAVFRGNFSMFFTGMFLHSDILHLFFNMLVLLVFGIILERRIGSVRFLTIYIVVHLVAKTFDLAIRPDSWIPAIGASAAISGIVGGCFLGFPTARAPASFLLWTISSGLAFLFGIVILNSYIIYILILISPLIVFILAPFWMAPLWPFTLTWIGFQIGMGVTVATLGIIGGVGYWSHIAGFVAGMLLILLLRPREPGEEVKPREETPAIR